MHRLTLMKPLKRIVAESSVTIGFLPAMPFSTPEAELGMCSAREVCIRTKTVILLRTNVKKIQNEVLSNFKQL